MFNAVGGTLLAGRIAIEHGIACSTGGGTHHAFPSHGAGYCLLNDMAVTAAVLFKECLVQKVLIVDLDVHQVGVVCIFDCRSTELPSALQNDIDLGQLSVLNLSS